MPSIQQRSEQDTIAVPIKEWERMQRELIRLRRKVNKQKVLDEIRSAIFTFKKGMADGKPPQGMDAREFVETLKNEK